MNMRILVGICLVSGAAVVAQQPKPTPQPPPPRPGPAAPMPGQVVPGAIPKLLVEDEGESAVITDPTPIDMTITSYRVTGMVIEVRPSMRLSIAYMDNLGKAYGDEHYGPERVGTDGKPDPTAAEALLETINISDFTADSMIKSMLNHLVAEGKIPPSTVTGTPPTPPPAGRSLGLKPPPTRTVKPTTTPKPTIKK